MFAPLMTAVADGLADAGVGVVRFDFRGVGASSGQHNGGVGEVNDVAAAVARAAEISPTVVLAGWSFGALVALEFITDLPEQHPYIGVAPPITDRDTFAHVHGAGVTFVIGSRDQVVDNDATLALARTIGASVRRVDTDHFFLGHSVPVVETILDACG